MDVSVSPLTGDSQLGTIFSMFNARRLLSFALCSLLCLTYNWAQARQSSRNIASTIEAKVALESSLEKRIQSVLTEVLGTDKVIVIINAVLLTEEGEKGFSGEILPGVPVKAAPSIPKFTLTTALTMVKKLSATIIIDEATSQEDEDLAKKVTQGLLGLVPDRGDKLVIERMAFQKTAPFSYKQLFIPPDLWKLLWIVLISTVLVVLLVTFLKPLLIRATDLASAVRSQGEAARAAAEEAMFRAGPAAGETEAAAGTAGGAGASAGTDHRESLPFGFIREDHVPNLIHLFKKAPPTGIAVVLHYLPPNMASRILSSIEANVRSQVIFQLSMVTEMPQAKIREIEKWIKSRVDFLVGGEDKLITMLDTSPPDVQEEIVREVSSKDPELAGRLNNRIVRLQDLTRLEQADIQNVLKRIPIPTMAQVLKTDEDIARTVLDKLPAGMSERLSQEMDFSRPLSSERLEAEKMRVINILKQMRAEGWITFKKGDERGLESRPSPEAEGSEESSPAKRDKKRAKKDSAE